MRDYFPEEIPILSTALDLSLETLYNSSIVFLILYYLVSSPLLVEEHLYTCKYAYDNIR